MNWCSLLLKMTPSPPEIIKTRLLRLNQETHYKTHFRERYPLDCRSKAGWRLEPLKNGSFLGRKVAPQGLGKHFPIHMFMHDYSWLQKCIERISDNNLYIQDVILFLGRIQNTGTSKNRRLKRETFCEISIQGVFSQV